ncbi:hypothetical protein FQN55_002104 [Onygenales sp. PD_40]|nr:hypothetical protein FQN55_002104 [Onygenales sp. PD_40]KAK2763029.1 hypothetical protein FQN53_007333 [Emmonsiellopsis sp. PD_33]KAK2782016.1 hypothetical protein FQN52_001240 [Onygenales sp. PD_12]KAK2799334.1 hypothetical protein FQN51_007012 [Onygenales sp. PD_10]
MSDSGDQSKVDKKREYNRNAQKVFRQRRKEHLKNLEEAERKRASMQNEELDRLRREINDLRMENESLHRFYGSDRGSPLPTSMSSPPAQPDYQLNPYTLGPSSFIDAPSPLMSQAQSVSGSTGSVPHPALCVLVPHDIQQIRSYLQVLFQPVLEVNSFNDPQRHLTLLSALAPSLPSQLVPTELQLSTPHNAYIDLIPSPSLRNSLIEAGCATAAAFLAQVCTFACDIEDHGQVIIWGEDFLNEISWEFSAAVLEQWGGWLLSPAWGERANFWRRQRGDPLLPAWNVATA